MSTGLLFNYFKTQEALYKELVQIGMSASNSQLPDENTDPIIYLSNTAKMIFDSLKVHEFTCMLYIFVAQVYYSGTVLMVNQLKILEKRTCIHQRLSYSNVDKSWAKFVMVPLMRWRLPIGVTAQEKYYLKAAGRYVLSFQNNICMIKLI